MNRTAIITALFTTIIFFLVACQKWSDPPPKKDPRLGNLYCNDPEAVNYNWGFPGTPNDSVCYYPADQYVGTYVYYDSVYLQNNVYSYSGDTLYNTLTMVRLSKTKMGVLGLCSGDTIKFTIDKSLHAAVDTDTVYGVGQRYCNVKDTVSGTITPSIANDSLFVVNLMVASDTGVNFHKGIARKKY